MKIYGVSGLLLSTGLAIGASIGPALAGGAVKASNVRLGQHPGKTRVVIDLNRKIEFSYDISDDGMSVFVHLPKIKWRANRHLQGRGKGIVSGFEYAAGADGTGQFVIHTNKSVQVDRLFMLDPDKKQGHRLVIDLKAGPSVAPPPPRPVAYTPLRLASIYRELGLPMDEELAIDRPENKSSTRIGILRWLAKTPETPDLEKPIKELNVDAKPKTKSKKPASSTPKMSTKPRSSPPRGAAYTYTLTPRFQYLMIPQTRGNDESFDAPFFGLTAGVTPPGKKDFDIQASIFYGQADSRSDVGLSTLTNADAEYFDTEILLRQYINESNAYVAFGGRYLHIETDDTLANSGLTFASSGANNIKTETDTYLGEIGVGYSSAITENSVHQLFGQFVLGLGYASEENNRLQSDDNATGFATLFDLNLGYQYAVSDTMSAHARYRAILLSDENIFNGTIAHGPEIGVTYKF